MRKAESSRRGFLAAATVAMASLSMVEPVLASTEATFDRAAFEARIRAPFAHRQVFASGSIAHGAAFGFMKNSLDAYERGFGEGPGTVHAACVFYREAVAMALDDEAWASFAIDPSAHGQNPYAHAANGRSIPELQQRNASFFVCLNALADTARHLGTTVDVLQAHLLPGMMLVPAGVAAINALQEEKFTLFVATM